MAENLKTKNYNDNTPIPNITNDIEWMNTGTGANNSTGFTALPGGVRYGSSDFGGFFYLIGTNGLCWSSTPGIEPTDHSL